MTIQSEFLEVRFAQPGLDYRAHRFDRSSLVKSVATKNGVEFLAGESLQADVHAGFGLCSEFGLRLAHGFDQCTNGERFSKIGVGTMLRPDQSDYDFRRLYPGFIEADLTREASSTSLTFRSRSRGSSNFAWELVRHWWVEQNVLSCTVELGNLGSEVIETDEYCHNFLRPGPGRSLASPGLELHASGTFACPPSPLVDPRAASVWTAEELRFNGPSDEDIWAPNIAQAQDGLSWWELRAGDSPWVREEISPRAFRMDIWAKTHVIAPELFLAITIAPGASKTWTRRWIFQRDQNQV